MPRENVRIKQEDVQKPEFITVEIEPVREDKPVQRVKEEPVWEENDHPVETEVGELVTGTVKDGYNVTVKVEQLKEEAVTEQDKIASDGDEDEKSQHDESATSDAGVDLENKCNAQSKRRTIGDGEYECHTCAKKFTVKSWLKKHIKIHHTPKLFSCSVCNKQFPYQCKLTAHERIHTGIKPFACKHCNKRFTNKCNLITHERVHTGEWKRIISCDVCQKKFTQKQHLESHKRLHTGQKPFACEICHDQFSQKQHVKTHMLIHTGEKPYECKTCGKRFKRASDIRRHERIHTGEKPYSCKLCGKRFVQKQHLVIHISYNRCSAMKPGG